MGRVGQVGLGRVGQVGQPLLHNSAGSQPSVFANTCGSRMTLDESRGLGASKGTADLAERF